MDIERVTAFRTSDGELFEDFYQAYAYTITDKEVKFRNALMNQLDYDAVMVDTVFKDIKEIIKLYITLVLDD